MIVMPQGEMAGAESVLLELLSACNTDEIVVAAPHGTPLADRASGLGFEVANFWLPKRAHMRTAAGYAAAVSRSFRMLDTAVRARRPLVIHAFLPLTLKVVVPVARAHHICAVASVHDVITPQAIGKIRSRIQAAFLRYGSRRIVAVSEYIRRTLIGVGLSPASVVTVHNGVSLPSALPDRHAARVALGLPPDRFVVALVARMTEWKGHDVALDALTEVKRATHVQPHLVFAGGAFEKGDTDYARSIAQRSAPEEVTLLGHLADTSLVYAAADVVVVPSTKPDPFPTVVLEAGIRERAAVATTLGGAREAIEHGKTGFLSAPDSHSIAEALSRFAALSARERRTIELRARAHIATKFSVERYAGEIAEVWTEALGR